MKNVIINGQETQLDVATLEQVIDHYQLKKEHVVAEVNGEIIDRDEWATRQIDPGAKIELVHFVGGG